MLTIQPSKSTPRYLSEGNANVCPHNNLSKNCYQFSYFQTENHPNAQKQGIVKQMLVYSNNVPTTKMNELQRDAPTWIDFFN